MKHVTKARKKGRKKGRRKDTNTEERQGSRMERASAVKERRREGRQILIGYFLGTSDVRFRRLYIRGNQLPLMYPWVPGMYLGGWLCWSPFGSCRFLKWCGCGLPVHFSPVKPAKGSFDGCLGHKTDAPFAYSEEHGPMGKWQSRVNDG